MVLTFFRTFDLFVLKEVYESNLIVDEKKVSDEDFEEDD